MITVPPWAYIDGLKRETEVLKKCLFQAQEASIYFIGQIDVLKSEIDGYQTRIKTLETMCDQFEDAFLLEHDENVRLHTENEEIKNEIKADPYVSKANYLEVIKERDYIHEKLDTLFDAIKHGDEAHQTWLKNAIETHLKENE